MVEVSPPYDHAEVTAYLGGRIVLEALSGVAWRQPGLGPGAGPTTRCSSAERPRRLRQGGEDLAHHVEGGVGVQEGQAADRLALPAGRDDEADLARASSSVDQAS